MSDENWKVSYELSFTGDDGDWAVARMWIDEALNRPYRATIDAATKVDDIDTEALLGASATLTMTRRDGEARHLYGVVAQIDYLGSDDHSLFVRFHLVPAFELLRQRVDSRIWQQASVQDIVAEVLEPLGDYDRSYDVGGTQRGSAPRDYCVQYRESDLGYVTRLLEEEGISYVFMHEPDTGHEVLTLLDDNRQYPAVSDPAEFRIISTHFEHLGYETLQSFEWVRRLTGTASLRRDFDWKTPKSLLTTPTDGADERGRIRRQFAHGQRRFIADDQAQQSSDLQKAGALTGATASGRSNATVLRPGFKFTISEHERGDLVGREYIVTQVVHTGYCPDVSTSLPDSGGPRYTNEFECVPADVEIRPARVTPKPRVQGPQTAIVTGPDGEEIHTDEHGRIHVQFHWEEQPSYAAESSCWVRCAQTWAGPSWGAQFIPRVGMEVVVEFLEGNPDRPLVIGCVYNGDNPAPFAVPGSKTQSGWRTNSSPGGGGSNELRFEDAAGSEEIYIHGQKDWRIAIDNNKSQTIGSDESRSVGNNESSSIGNDQTLSVGNNQTNDIGNDQTENVGNNRTETIGNDHALTLGNDQTLTIGNNQNVSIATDRGESIGAEHSQTVGASKTVAVSQMYNIAVGIGFNIVVGAEMAQGVGGALSTTVGASSSETIIGDKSVSASDIAASARGEWTVSAGKKLSMAAKDDIGVKGDKNGMIEFAKKLVLKCGDASITLKKNGDIVLKGKNISVKGSGDVKLKGSKIGNN